MATNIRSTLESIITRYRREAGQDSNVHPELEIRLQDVDYANFSAIHEALLAKTDIEVGDGKITQMVGSIMDTRSTARGEGLQRHLRGMRIREVFFEKGKRSHDQYVYKEPLLIPFRVPSTVGLAYIVALSAERPDEHEFSSDEGAVIRVKARVSFYFTLEGTSEMKPSLRWRVDMTVTRQIMGSDAQSSLRQIVGQMFRTTPGMTPANYLTVLRLDDDVNPAARQLYRFEVEVEFAGDPDSRDTIRPADVTAAAGAILRLANPEYVREASRQAEIYRAARHIVKAPGYLARFQHEFGIKRLLPQALAITRADYRAIYPPKGHYLTDKADGKRALAIVHDGKGVIVSDNLYDGFAPVSGKDMRDPKYTGDTVVDGELIVGGSTIAFYAFDVIAVADEEVARDGFETRLGRLDEAVQILRDAGVPATAKSYTRLASDSVSDLKRAIQEVHTAKRPYAIDGLIFVEPGKPYDETRNNKWKDAMHNTIDFLARRAPASVLGKSPFTDAPGHKLFFLFVGISPEIYSALGLQRCPGYVDLFGDESVQSSWGRANTGSYFPVQFAPSDAPLAYLYQHPDSSPLGDIEGNVVEGRCTGGCLAAGGGTELVSWDMVRIREDRRRELLSKRYYGNDFYSAELIWLNYVDPFPIEQLWDGPALDYFMRPKAGIYHAQTAVISYVKTQRIASFKHASKVVDLGAGKGQDLNRYLNAEIQHLFAVDQDRAALSELVRRKYTFARRSVESRDSGGRGKARTATTVHILATDLSDPHMTTLKKLAALGLQRETADAVICNLAVHYFLDSADSMRNFVALARGAVKIGGHVVITALFGENVDQLFKKEGVRNGGTWDVLENGGLKYSLKRMYSSGVLEPTGQRIGTLLPFSEGQYYEEYLVNTKALTAEFVSRGFSLVAKADMTKSIADFSARNHALAALLTEDDRRYLSLYGELVYERNK